MIPLSWHCNLLSDVVWNLQHFVCSWFSSYLVFWLYLQAIFSIFTFIRWLQRFLLAFFFFSLALHLEMKHLILELLFHTSIPWNQLDQFWGFCLFVFDLITPFRVGCRDGKQEPAHTSQSLRSADTSLQFLHKIQRISGLSEEWKFAEAAEQFSPRVLYNAAFSAHLYTRRFPVLQKSQILLQISPKDVQSNAGVILPTHNDLHIKPRGQQPTLFRDSWFLYL